MNKPQVESFDLTSILSKGFTHFTLFSCYTTKENKKVKSSAFLFKTKNKIKAYSFVGCSEISLIGVFKSKSDPIIRSVNNTPILCISEGKNINFYSTVINDRNIGEKLYSIKCSNNILAFEITKKVLALSYKDRTDVYHIRFDERWKVSIKNKETFNEGSLLKLVNENILISLDNGKVITKFTTTSTKNNSTEERISSVKRDSSFLLGEEILSSDTVLFSKSVFIGAGLILIPESNHVTVFTMGNNEILTIIDTETSSLSYHNGVLASLYEESLSAQQMESLPAYAAQQMESLPAYAAQQMESLPAYAAQQMESSTFILVLFNLNTLTNEVGEFLNKTNSKGIMDINEKSVKLTTYDDDVYFVVQLLTDRQMKLDGGDYKKYRPNRDRDRQLEGNW